MASLRANMAVVSGAAIASRASAEASIQAKVGAARAARDGFARALDLHKEKLASLDGLPVESLPDEDAALAEHFQSIDVTKGRIRIGEKKLELSEVALAEAEVEFRSDRDVNGTAFQRAAAERERVIENFDAHFAERAKKLFDLIRSAMIVEAEAAGLEKKPSARAVRPAPEFDRDHPNFASLRIELVGKKGLVLWRGDQFTDSESDPETMK